MPQSHSAIGGTANNVYLIVGNIGTRTGAVSFMIPSRVNERYLTFATNLLGSRLYQWHDLP